MKSSKSLRIKHAEAVKNLRFCESKAACLTHFEIAKYTITAYLKTDQCIVINLQNKNSHSAYIINKSVFGC